VSPKKEHGEAIKWLGHYLKGTRDKCLILRLDGESRLEVFVDADFVENWDALDTDRDSARSRHELSKGFKQGSQIVANSNL
jgi:hypothetical protein